MSKVEIEFTKIDGLEVEVKIKAIFAIVKHDKQKVKEEIEKIIEKYKI